jgi:hypothetical protein
VALCSCITRSPGGRIKPGPARSRSKSLRCKEGGMTQQIMQGGRDHVALTAGRFEHGTRGFEISLEDCGDDGRGCRANRPRVSTQCAQPRGKHQRLIFSWHRAPAVSAVSRSRAISGCCGRSHGDPRKAHGSSRPAGFHLTRGTPKRCNDTREARADRASHYHLV